MATNNAFEDYPLQLWQDGLNVNLTGVFLASQAASRTDGEAGERLDHQYLLHLWTGWSGPAHL